MNPPPPSLGLRPPVPKDFGREDITFQILVVDVRNQAVPTVDISDRRPLFYDVTYKSLAPVEEDRNADRTGPNVVYVFGVSDVGNSVCIAVSNFRPFFYVELTAVVTSPLVRELAASFEDKMRMVRGSVTVTFERKKRAYGWVPITSTDPTDVREFLFAKLSFPTVAAMRFCAFLIEAHATMLQPASKYPDEQEKQRKAVRLPSCLESVRERLDISEVKVQPSEKFLAERGLIPSAWATVNSGAYTVVDSTERATDAQIEVTCSIGALYPAQIDRIGSIVVAAVDIEAQSGDYRSFPEARKLSDCCNYIGTTFWVYGDRQPRARVMQVLGDCDPAEGIIVESYETEYELLVAWRDLITLRSDPDKVVSFNGTGFDYPYLYGRFQLLHSMQVPREYSRFCHLGRFLFESKRLEKRELSSAAMGQNEIHWFPLPGRWQMDLFQYVKINYKMSSYRLDDVCAHFLKDSAVTGKVVLDYPGWVAEMTNGAVAVLREAVAEVHALNPGASMTFMQSCLSHCDDAVARTASPLQVAVARDALATVIDEGEEKEDDDSDGRWMHVHEGLQEAVHAFGKVVETVTVAMESPLQAEALRERMQLLLDASVQPALDASGSNNYKKLFRLYNGTAAHRSRIASYCQVDCDLLLFLMDRINVIPNTVQMSQVTHTPLDDIANRGQQIKTFNLIARFAHNDGYVMNFIDVGWDVNTEYEGATVLPPKPAYYERPVATLDFASLYPSLMQAFNLCFSSIVLNPAYDNMEAAQYGRYDIGGREWVFQEHHKGLLPRILESLLGARRACKKEMKKFDKGSLDYRLADGRQLALKISCNSVYGFTGVVNNGMFPCMPVAVATTWNGRNVIAQTKKFMEDNYNADVIYGDTDSVMVQYPDVNTVVDCFAISERAAAAASAIFRNVILLEFEKVYFPYLLVGKKHYAGMKYEDDPHAEPTLDAKGLAVVRRDNCELVRTTMREVLHHVMRDGNPQAAYDAVERQVQRLLRREVELSELEISNFLRTDLKTDHHPHVQVVKNMQARKAFGVPRCGDRVPYVILEGAKGTKIYERAEHPKYVTEQGLKVDLAYYLHNQMQKRLEKVLIPLPIPSVDRLFDGALKEVERNRLGLRSLDEYFLPIARAGTTEAVRHPVSRKRARAKAPAMQQRLDGKLVPVKKATKSKSVKGSSKEARQMSLVAFMTEIE